MMAKISGSIHLLIQLPSRHGHANLEPVGTGIYQPVMGVKVIVRRRSWYHKEAVLPGTAGWEGSRNDAS
jgi:hypothetical protein